MKTNAMLRHARVIPLAIAATVSAIAIAPLSIAAEDSLASQAQPASEPPANGAAPEIRPRERWKGSKSDPPQTREALQASKRSKSYWQFFIVLGLVLGLSFWFWRRE